MNFIVNGMRYLVKDEYDVLLLKVRHDSKKKIVR